MSGAELARKIGVSRQYVNKLLNGRFDPPLSRLYDIADALGITIFDLISS